MESDENDDRTQQQVADYYRNYSETANLHKFFSNNPLSYLPPHKAPESDQSPPLPKSTDAPKSPVNPDPLESENNTPVSDKRLEWDSGADIGYQNYQSKQNLFKSTSLPTLRNTKRIKVCTDFLKVSDCKCKGKTDDGGSTSSNSKAETRSDVTRDSASRFPDKDPVESSKSSSSKPSGSDESPPSEVAVKCSSGSSNESPPAIVAVKYVSSTSNEPSRGKVVTNSSCSSNEPSCSKIAVKSSSSSSSEPSRSEAAVKRCVSSSNKQSRASGASRSSGSDDRDVRQFKATLEYLRSKIGLPVTNSTPKSEYIGSSGGMRTSADITPVCSDPATPRVKNPPPSRRIELVLTKPVTMEVEGARATASGDEGTQTDRHVSDKGVNVGGDLAEASVQTSRACESDKIDKATSVSNLETFSEPPSLEDVEKMVRRLCKFVKSERHDSSDRKRRIKEILRGLKCLDESSGSSELFMPKKVAPDSKHGGQVASSGSTDVSAAFRTSSSNDWRDKETLSEKRLDSNGGRIGEALRQLIRSEKAWLDQKNDHLTKLKDVLEAFGSRGGSRVRRSRYKVRGGAVERDYVIETELGAPDVGHTRFDVDGESYSVSSSDYKGNEAVLGGIDVETRGTTTSIKVKTFCDACKRSACRCEGGALAEKYQAVTGGQTEGADSSESRLTRNSFEAALHTCTCNSKCSFLGKFLKRFGAYTVESEATRPKSVEDVAVQSEPTAPNKDVVAHSEAQTETDVKDVGVQASGSLIDDTRLSKREAVEPSESPRQRNKVNLVKMTEKRDVAAGTDRNVSLASGKVGAKFCARPVTPKPKNLGGGAAHACQDLKYCDCAGGGTGMRYTLTLRDDVERKRTKERENHRKKDVIVLEKWKADAGGQRRDGKGRELTLAEYLIINRPGFVKESEFRRRTLYNSRLEREELKEAAKFRVIENNEYRAETRPTKRLFSEKEMKEITKKTYRKLPEIQRKLSGQRENRLRNVDKLIANMFNKKIQKCVLKGQINFPIDANLA